MPARDKPPESEERATAFLRLELLRVYKPSMLRGDITAGIMIFVATVPAALAFAHLAGLKPVHGLYASLLAMAVYACFGTSRQLIIGTESVMSILVFTSVGAIYSGGDPARFATLVALQAVMVGAIQILAGLFRLGYLSDFIPKAVITGFVNGMALIIIMSQAGQMAGIELENWAFFPRFWELISKYQEAHLLNLYVGAACLLGMVILHPWLRRIPDLALVAALAALAVTKWNLDAAGVPVIGQIAAGLPPFAIPEVEYADILTMFPVAVGVSLVSYVETITTGRVFASRGGYHLDLNQELIALGLANVGSGLFKGFAVSSSHQRTAINEMFRGRSQLTGLVAAVLLGAFLFYLTDIVKNIPIVALSAIIIMAGFRLLRPLELAAMFRARPSAGYVCVATTLAVLIAGLMTGILVAVALAIILMLHNLARPHETVIRPKSVPGLLIYRFAAPLLFINAPYFANRVQELIDESPQPVTFFLINAEAIVDMDSNAAEVLEELQFSLKSQGITMGVCEVKGHFSRVLKGTRLPGRVDFVIYPSVAAAVRELSKEEAKAQKKQEAESEDSGSEDES